MSDKVQCDTHGECEEAYLCHHLSGEAAGLGFNSDDPDSENAWPDAWCDNCELIRAASDGWTEESEKLTTIVLVCSECYEQIRIRNSRQTVTLDDLESLRWKCGSCDHWHTGPCLDFGFSTPYYWRKEYESESLPSGKTSTTFLDEDRCVIQDEYFFVRGIIHLPILGTGESFRWGIWGSLSRENFERLQMLSDDQERTDLPAMFAWLSNQIPEYPDTLSLKMYAHIQGPGQRPHFELQLSDHPLSQEYHKGISPERVKQIMLSRLPETAAPE